MSVPSKDGPSALVVAVRRCVREMEQHLEEDCGGGGMWTRETADRLKFALVQEEAWHDAVEMAPMEMTSLEAVVLEERVTELERKLDLYITLNTEEGWDRDRYFGLSQPEEKHLGTCDLASREAKAAAKVEEAEGE